VLNSKAPHHLQTLNRFGLPENIVVAELVAERLAALVLLEWDLVSSVLVVYVVVFAVNVVVKFVVPVHCVALVAVPVPVDVAFSD
jgi:putative flippase GtrA